VRDLSAVVSGRIIAKDQFGVQRAVFIARIDSTKDPGTLPGSGK
jgi:hypothetical protein